uniref:Uncharacterized protein n=1 Tax=Salix viminalis TaxID=40686 RepID=A0A6N2N8A5_SALVM
MQECHFLISSYICWMLLVLFVRTTCAWDSCLSSYRARADDGVWYQSAEERVSAPTVYPPPPPPPARSYYSLLKSSRSREDKTWEGGRILRALFGAAIFWGVIRFMYVGILPSHATTLMASIRVPSAGAFKHLKLSGGESHLVRHDMDLNYVSKRRVPNGPDPIHNRYTLLSTESF